MDDMFDSREVTPAMGHNSGAASLDALMASMPEVVTLVPAWQLHRHGDLASRITSLIEASARVPKTITADTEAEKFSDFRKQLISAQKAADAVRLEDKKQMSVIGDAVHAFWTKRTTALADALTPVDSALRAYLRKKEEAAAAAAAKDLAKQQAAADKAVAKGKEPPPIVAAPEPVKASVSGDYGSTTSTRKVWTFRDVNRQEIDLEALRPYLTADAVESAIRQYIKAGNRTLKGAIIFEETKIATR